MKRADHTELKNYETLIRIEIKTKDLDFGYEIAKFRHCLLAGWSEDMRGIGTAGDWTGSAATTGTGIASGGAEAHAALHRCQVGAQLVAGAVRAHKAEANVGVQWQAKETAQSLHD